MQKVDKKKKEREKSFRKEQYSALQNTLHMTMNGSPCVHIEQDKWRVVKEAVLRYASRSPHRELLFFKRCANPGTPCLY